MHVSRLALVGELRRAGRLLHGDPDFFDDLMQQLEEVWEMVDEATVIRPGPDRPFDWEDEL